MTAKTSSFIAGIANTLRSSDMSPLDPAREPQEDRRSIVIDLTQLEEDEADYNPRLTINEKFDEIKASIESRGIDNPVPVTQRPGSNLYIRKAGGRTRCRALRELFEETGDYERYGKLETIFVPWVSETDLIIGHATENLLRAGLNFYEQAAQERAIRESICKEDPTFLKASLADRQARYEHEGLRIDRTYLSTFDYVFESLHPALEKQLLNGMQIRTIKAIRSLETKLSAAQQNADREPNEDFNGIFCRTVLQHGGLGDDLDFDLFEKELIAATAASLNADPKTLLKQHPSKTKPLPIDPDNTSSDINTSQGAETGQALNTVDHTSDENPFDSAEPTPTTSQEGQGGSREGDSDTHQGNQSSAPDTPVDREEALSGIREEAVSIATSLATDHGLLAGSFYRLDNIALGYGLDSPDHASILHSENNLESLCVFLEMHSLFWTVLMMEIEYGRVSQDAKSELNQDTFPNAITDSEAYRKMHHAESYCCLNTMRFKAAADRAEGTSSIYTDTIDRLVKLQNLSETYVRTLVSKS